MSDFIETLFQTIQDRKLHPKAGSYTSSLFTAGEDEIVKKVGEEAVEVILAVKGQGKQRIVEETADLTYHLLVLLTSCDLTWEDVCQELAQRHKPGN
ncbi:MAG TPA: phosphoribosyl-ATP diphosphatase [Chloroflexota bacterium]|nr:phosphoribosyl-ATP diphosphatase [Chloroflexota bacterium]HUM69460.1 phosphoribosyl-ATP diphosphatase [Chloroflexota bacterium]